MRIFSFSEALNFMRFKWPALMLSALLVLGSLGLLAVKGINWGLDFTGGTVLEVGFTQDADLTQVRNVLAERGYAAKNPRVARRRVASAATALTPFSQNSNEDCGLRSGQAQPGQSKPSGWLARSKVRAPRPTMPCSRTWWKELARASQPPAAPV